MEKDAALVDIKLAHRINLTAIDPFLDSSLLFIKFGA